MDITTKVIQLGNYNISTLSINVNGMIVTVDVDKQVIDNNINVIRYLIYDSTGIVDARIKEARRDHETLFINGVGFPYLEWAN